MSYKYWVDVRVGCCAIRDSTMSKIDEPILDENTKGVMKYFEGRWDEAGCHWYLPLEVETEARKLCDEMNRGCIENK